MKKISKRTALVAVATAGATIVASGLAYAFWSTNGSGSAAATAGNAIGVKGVAAPTTSGTLYPNGNVAASITINNPNTFPVKVSRVQIAAGSQPTSVTGGSGCTAANSLVTASGDTGVLVGGAQLSIPASSSITTTVGTIAMGLAADNGCQGASFQFGSDLVAGPVVVTAQAG